MSEPRPRNETSPTFTSSACSACHNTQLWKSATVGHKRHPFFSGVKKLLLLEILTVRRDRGWEEDFLTGLLPQLFFHTTFVLDHHLE